MDTFWSSFLQIWGASQSHYREGVLQNPQGLHEVPIEKGFCKAPIEEGFFKAPIQKGLHTHIHTHFFIFCTDMVVLHKVPREGILQSPRGLMKPP